MMNRKTFLKTGTLLAGSLSAFPLLSQRATQDISGEMIKAFVSAGHNKLEKVKELLAEEPNLLFARYDWGGGDFEEAIEGAGHVGNKEIANYLIEQGARPNLFVLTMLGYTAIVQQVLDDFPSQLSAKGPHGFTLLHHAKVGGQDELINYLQSKGLKETKLSIK